MKKQLRRFLRLTGYHRKFIKVYSELARPLHDLTKDVPYRWEDAQQKAFEMLKASLMTTPVLAFPKDKGEFRLETDVSMYVTGAVLSQLQDGIWRTLSYASKSITGTQQNYTTYDKEMLGVM
jgi:hypothetical protein